jgi:anti-anti-sigma factor
MKSDFVITAEQENGTPSVTIFHINGDIDTNTYRTLEEAARQAYEGGTRFLLLDLSQVDYVSSAGLRGFHAIYKMLQEGSEEQVGQGLLDGSYKSRHLKLLNPNQNVRYSLKMSGFDMYIDSFDDRMKALASFA